MSQVSVIQEMSYPTTLTNIIEKNIKQRKTSFDRNKINIQ